MGGWYIGAAINLVGSTMINLGTNVMKLGHNKRAELEARIGKKCTIRKFREWQFGVSLFILGNVANFISFGYAAQSLLAALGSVQFISNVLFASLVLKEKVTKTVVLATICIVSGCVALVSFGSHESKQFTVEELMGMYRRPAYMAYIIFLGITVVIMYGVYKCGRRKMSKVGLSGLSPCWYRLLPISYALYSGLLGTQSVLFGKTLSTLLRVSMGGNSQLGSWFTWLVILTFLCTSTFWVTRLNKALKLFPALMIVPTMQISWTLFSILSGMLYFEEYKGFNHFTGCMFILAVLVIFFGVYLLTRDQNSNPNTPNIEKYGNMVSAAQISPIDHDKDLLLQGSKTNELRREDGASPDKKSLLEIGVPLTNGYQPSDAVATESEDDNRPDCVSTLAPGLDRSSTTDMISNSIPLVALHGPHQKPQHLAENASLSSSEAMEMGNSEAQPMAQSEEQRPSLLRGIVEDFGVDVWSSVKETIGIGPEPTPAVSLFGPPELTQEERFQASHNCPSRPETPRIVESSTQDMFAPLLPRAQHYIK